MLEYDYIVYGGFDVLVKSLQAVALIFSSSSYKGLFISFFVLLFIYIISSYYMSALTGLKPVGFLEWAQTFWWAIFLYTLMIVPVGTLHLYDASKNRYQSISGLPAGVVMTAGVLNKIEEGLRQIVETAMNPIISYRDANMGSGFDMIAGLYGYVRNRMKFENALDRTNLNRYIEDCLLMELMIGVRVTPEGLKTDPDIFFNSMTNANRALYTVMYTEQRPNGFTATCYDAYNGCSVDCYDDKTGDTTIAEWQGLKNIFDTQYLDNFLVDYCSTMGYSADSMEETQRCKEIFSAHLSNLLNSSVDPSHLFLQMHIAQYINDMVLYDSPTKVAEFVGQRRIGTEMVGVGMLAQKFIPMFINVVRAIMFVMTPLLFLLMVVFPIEAFKYFIGMFVWITCWSVTDVMLHSFFMNYAYDYFTSLRKFPTSYVSIFLFDTDSSQVLAILGYVRVIGIMLSSSIVYGIMRFGGEAFARVAQSIQGRVESTGSQAGSTALQHEEKSKYVENSTEGIARLTHQTMYGWNDRVGQRIQDRVRGTEVAKTTANAFGGHAQAGTSTGQAAGSEQIMNTMSTDTFVNQVSKTTGWNTLDTAKWLGGLAGMDRAGIAEATYSASLDAMNKKYGVRGGAAEGLKSILDNVKSEETFNRVLSNARPEVQKLAEKLGWGKEGVTLDDVRNRFNTEVQDTTTSLRRGLSEYGFLDKAGDYNQSLLAAANLFGFRDYDGDGTISDMDRSMSLYMLANAEHARKEITLDEATAKRLNEFTGSNVFRAGDRARIAFDPETGGITLAHAQSGIYRFKQDGSLESTQYNKKGLKKLADRLAKEGHRNVASYLREELIPRLREGEVAQVNLQRDKTGKIATAEIKHGSALHHFDAAKREWTTRAQDWDGIYGGIAINDAKTYEATGNTVSITGTMRKGDETWKTMLELARSWGDEEFVKVLESMDENKAISYEIEGDRSGRISEFEVEQELEGEKKVVGRMHRIYEDKAIDKTTRDYGIEQKGTVWGLLSGDHRVAELIADIDTYKKNKDEWEARLKVFAENAANETKEWFDRIGVDAGSSSVKMGGGINIGKLIPLFKIDTGGEVRRENREQDTYNLLSAEVRRRAESAVLEAWTKGLRGEEVEKYVVNKVGKWYRENIYNKAADAVSEEFGGSAVTDILSGARGKRKLEKIKKEQVDK